MGPTEGGTEALPPRCSEDGRLVRLVEGRTRSGVEGDTDGVPDGEGARDGVPDGAGVPDGDGDGPAVHMPQLRRHSCISSRVSSTPSRVKWILDILLHSSPAYVLHGSPYRLRYNSLSRHSPVGAAEGVEEGARVGARRDGDAVGTGDGRAEAAVEGTSESAAGEGTAEGTDGRGDDVEGICTGTPAPGGGDADGTAVGHSRQLRRHHASRPATSCCVYIILYIMLHSRPAYVPHDDPYRSR